MQHLPVSRQSAFPANGRDMYISGGLRPLRKSQYNKFSRAYNGKPYLCDQSSLKNIQTCHGSAQPAPDIKSFIGAVALQSAIPPVPDQKTFNSLPEPRPGIIIVGLKYELLQPVFN
jgi:hypothetical protein